MDIITARQSFQESLSSYMDTEDHRRKTAIPSWRIEGAWGSGLEKATEEVY